MSNILELERMEGRKEGREEGRMEGILTLVCCLRQYRATEEEITSILSERFSLTEEEVKKILTK